MFCHMPKIGNTLESNATCSFQRTHTHDGNKTISLHQRELGCAVMTTHMQVKPPHVIYTNRIMRACQQFPRSLAGNRHLRNWHSVCSMIDSVCFVAFASSGSASVMGVASTNYNIQKWPGLLTLHMLHPQQSCVVNEFMNKSSKNLKPIFRESHSFRDQMWTRTL